MLQKFLLNNFSLIEVLKENEVGKIELLYDKKNRRLCIFKNISSPEIYSKLKKIKNPHIPEFFFLSKNFVIEEYIEGKNLSEVLDSEKISDKKIMSILLQLCECLKILHAEGIIHRDIKPTNLILQGDKIFLIDFGISRLIKDNSESDTNWIGTRGYAPPEQFGFGQTDARSDIYSLGATLNLFQPKSKKLRQIIHKATNFDPDLRFQSVHEILSALQENNFLDKLKNYFIKPQKLEELLQEYLLSFKLSLPKVEDYEFKRKNYTLETKLQYPDDYNYIFANKSDAESAGLKSFNEKIFSRLDDFILQILEQYKARQLKNFLSYELSKQNFYYKTNCEVERRIKTILKKCRLNFTPDLINFNCVPDFEKLQKFSDVKIYLPEVRELVLSLGIFHDCGDYEKYIETRKDRYGIFCFHIDDAVKVLFDNILWAVEFLAKISDNLRDNIHTAITDSYAEKFSQQLKIKAEEIKKFAK